MRATRRLRPLAAWAAESPARATPPSAPAARCPPTRPLAPADRSHRDRARSFPAPLRAAASALRRRRSWTARSRAALAAGRGGGIGGLGIAGAVLPLSPHRELVQAGRALHRHPRRRDAVLIEVVLGATPLAGDFHGRFAGEIIPCCSRWRRAESALQPESILLKRPSVFALEEWPSGLRRRS